MSEPTSRTVTVRFDAELWHRFKVYAAVQGCTMGSILEALVRKLMEGDCQKIK
jgi:hypothetical protein